MRDYQIADELYHWGIKGMKWGVRKDRKMSEDAATAKALKKKKLDELSNAELKKLNERKNLEQQYKNLNPSTIKKGAKAVGSAAAVMGTAIAIYNNSHTIVKICKEVVNKMKR